MKDDTLTVQLSERAYRELQSLLLHYTTRTDRWAISSELRLAVAGAEPPL